MVRVRKDTIVVLKTFDRTRSEMIDVLKPMIKLFKNPR
jgi:hypothetical protein